MKAGRELDALVAEKVMGWAYKPFYNGGGEWSHDGKQVAFGGLDGGSLPNYSTSIADAWQVVEKMHDEHAFTLEYVGSWYVAQFWSNKKKVISRADTAPLAICKAALAAYGVKYE